MIRFKNRSAVCITVALLIAQSSYGAFPVVNPLPYNKLAQQWLVIKPFVEGCAALIFVGGLYCGQYWLQKKIDQYMVGVNTGGFYKNIQKMVYKSSVTFADVIGLDEIVQELKDVARSIKNNDEAYKKMGVKTVNGVLLVGCPGTGKTYLAKALANEVGYPFYSVSGAEFDDTYVGVGAARVRELFKKARDNAPSIIFIDDIDAITAKREMHYVKEHDQTLNQLLTEIDGLATNDDKKVIVVAATSRPDILDAAIKRPGRFDIIIHVPMPGLKAREAILRKYAEKRLIADDVNWQAMAALTHECSPAELANLVNRAAILAVRDHSDAIYMRHLKMAWEQGVVGMFNQQVMVSPQERLATAYHESGHALVLLLNPITAKTPLYKIIIDPTDKALGLTFYFPSIKSTRTRDELIGVIMYYLGGRVAEELQFGSDGLNTGAYNDYKKATDIARLIVCEYGMESDFAGVLYDYDRLSSEMKVKVDAQVQMIMENCYMQVKHLLTENRQKLDVLAEKLHQQGVITAREIGSLLNIEVLDEQAFINQVIASSCID